MVLLWWLARNQMMKIKTTVKIRITSSSIFKNPHKIIYSVRIENQLICFRLNHDLCNLMKMAVNKMRRIYFLLIRSLLLRMRILMMRKMGHKMIKLLIRASMLSNQTLRLNRWNTRIRLNFVKNCRYLWRNSKMGNQ